MRLITHFTLTCLFLCGTWLLPATSTAEEQKPNVLMIVSDDLTCCLGSYGNEVCRTPNLDRLAKAGVRFTRTYCQYPVCGPSRASFMSGLYPEQNGVMGNNYTEGSFRTITPELADHPSLGGFLRRNGYVSLRVSKIYHMGVPGGIEAGSSGGDDPDSWDQAFNIMAPETASPGELELLSPKKKHYGSNFARIQVPDGMEGTQADYLAASQAIAILENRARTRIPPVRNSLKPGDPFFLAVGLVRPHVPSVAPQRLFDHYDEKLIQLPYVPEGDLNDIPRLAAAMQNEPRYGMNETQKRQAIAAYYASVEFMDEQVGRLLDALDRLQIRDNTIVIFTSDHGFQLGEHDMWQKLSLFEASTRVPLLISAPGYEQTAGTASDELVELLDIYPTVVDLVGLKAEAPQNLAGHSLRPLLADSSESLPREFAYTVTHNGGRSLRSAEWRYNIWKDGSEELYDLKSDPQQFHNLAQDAAHADQLQLMQKKLEQKRSELSRK
ncbi:sulfatase [Rubinisphaera sp. JC750]|uniref:sulfatase n=1 Tax=Rubinisphaera sp. JC750 TaxID=2898658 RepID=UPI001F27E00E|nr:sulfatase [Rubinisphaera sp. JC750]